MITAVKEHPGKVMSAEDYHASPGVSNSRLSDFLDDPRLYYFKYVDGSLIQEPKKHFDFGSAVHDICLLGSAANIEVIPQKALSTSGSKAGNAWKAWAEEHAGKIHLKQHEMDAVLRCVEAVNQHPVAGKLLSAPGPAEHSFWFVDPDIGFRVKCRPDKLVLLPQKRICVDLKTTGGAVSASKFAKHIADFGYHRQRYLYGKVLARCGIEIDEFVFIAVSTEEPHLVNCYTIDEEFVRIAEEEVEQGLADLAERHRAKDWLPITHSSVVKLAPPSFLKYQGEYQL